MGHVVATAVLLLNLTIGKQQVNRLSHYGAAKDGAPLFADCRSKGSAGGSARSSME